MSHVSLFGARETASSSADQRRRKHIGEAKHSHTPTTTPKHGVTGEKATRSVEEHDQTVALGPLQQRITRIVLYSSFDRVRRRRDLHPLGWEQASGPETRARVLFRLRSLEKVLGFADVIVRDGVDHPWLPSAAHHTWHGSHVFATSLQRRSIPVGSRTSPVPRQDVPRKNLNHFSRITHTCERPASS